MSVTLDPLQYLAAWRERAGALFLPTLSGARVGEEVAVRIAIRGHPIHATLFGRIALVRRVGRPTLPPGVELKLRRQSAAAAAFLAMAARGEPISFKERGPRFPVERTFVVEHGSGPCEVTAVNVSEAGCTLRWQGLLPAVGDVLAIRVKEGFFSARVGGVVCWVEPDGGLAGVMVLAQGRGGRAWRSLVQGVARSGAHAA